MGRIMVNGENYSGSEVVANPTLSGTETNLTGLEVDGTKYAVTGGGGSQKIPYLKSSGTQYIDTGIKPSGKISIIAEFFLDIDQQNRSDSWQSVFGGNDGNTINSIVFSFNQSGSSVTFQDGAAYGDIGSLFITSNYIHNVAIIKGITEFDGIARQIWSPSQFTSNNNIYLFGQNLNGVASYLSKICLTKCKIYNDDNLIADFVPVVHNNVACLYDKVSQNYFTSQGTGTFIYGEL